MGVVYSICENDGEPSVTTCMYLLVSYALTLYRSLV